MSLIASRFQHVNLKTKDVFKRTEVSLREKCKCNDVCKCESLSSIVTDVCRLKAISIETVVRQSYEAMTPKSDEGAALLLLVYERVLPSFGAVL